MNRSKKEGPDALISLFSTHIFAHPTQNMRKILLSFISIFILQLAYSQQDSTLQHYTGKYKFAEGSVVTEVTVSLENGLLFAISTMGGSELRRTEGDVFDIVAYGGVATFKRKEGKVNAVQMIVGNLILEGEKTETGSIQGIGLVKPLLRKYL
jgi:hypothetical protein